MYYNKYGIIIKKSLKEKYHDKYFELQEQGILNNIIDQKQMEIARLKKDLITSAKSTSILFKKQLIAIQESVSEEIKNIVNEIGADVYKLNEKT